MDDYLNGIVASWTSTPLPLRFALTGWLVLGCMYLVLGAYESMNGLAKHRSRRVHHHNWPIGVFTLLTVCIVAYRLAMDVDGPHSIVVSPAWAAAVVTTGFFIMARGLMYALAGRIALNGHWGQKIYKYDRQEDDIIIKRGIYTRMRHPIYVGQAMMAIGTFLVSGDWALASLPILVVVYNTVRAWTESRQLAILYGDSFRAYKREVPPFAIVVNPIGWPKLVAFSELTEIEVHK